MAEFSIKPQACGQDLERSEAPAKASSAGGVLVIACAGVVLASLDVFVVNVALPQIARDFGTSDLSGLSWVLNGYAIVYASLLVFFGRLADRYRRDRAFLLGVAIFTAASAACAASTSVAMLVGFRVVQAAGAALLTPTSLGLVLASYEPERRHGAVRAWTAVGGLGAAIGPVVGGLLVTASWRWVFLVNIPVGIAALLVGWRRLPEVPGHATERPDPLGVVLVTTAVGLLTFALVKGPDWGWSSPAMFELLVAAAALMVGFVLHCLHSRTPLVHPELFRSRSFTGASIIAVFFSTAFGALLLSIVLWEQEAWGWSALRTGLAISPGPLMVPLISFGVAGHLIRRYGSAAVVSAGSLCFSAGLAWWALAVTSAPDYVSGVLGGMLLSGVGVGLTLPTLMASAAASLPPHSFATGSAVINMIRQTGLALGVAILVAVLETAAVHHAPRLAAYQYAWWLAAAISAAGIVPALGLLRRLDPAQKPSPQRSLPRRSEPHRDHRGQPS
jgi:EmrB/QacA subfamily drug resistance transporter